DYHLCRLGGSVGRHSDGAFASLVCVPDYTLVPLEDSVSSEQGALTEPFAVALHALKRAALAPGETVLVLGFGPIGAAGALLVGLGKETASVDPRRLTLFERSALGSLGYRHDLPTVVAMTGAGLVDPAAIVTDVIPLSRAPEAFARLAADPGGNIKVLVQPDS